VSDLNIRIAKPSEARALGRLVAESFSALPVCQWLASDPTERLAGLSGQFGMLVGAAIEHGVVYTLGEEDNQLAAGVWFAPGEFPDIPGYDEGLAAACGANLARFVELDEIMHGGHPESPAHAYLALMAVRASERNRGIGSVLLDEHHRLLDADGAPAYLEASGRPARRLYLRHGYVDSGEPYGPAGINEFLPMWREPAE
jgi:GNAT superfamily N-acetyltransferase